jgi:hypothetical protein
VTILPIAIRLSHRYHNSHLTIKTWCTRNINWKQNTPYPLPSFNITFFHLSMLILLFFLDGAFQFWNIYGYMVYLKVWTKPCEDKRCKIIIWIEKLMVFYVIKIQLSIGDNKVLVACPFCLLLLGCVACSNRLCSLFVARKSMIHIPWSNTYNTN